MNTTDIGRLGERAAAKYLKKNRYKILESNVYVSHNEIDIVAINKKDNVIVFVEIKTRSVDDDLYSPFGTPASSVTKAKQTRTLEAAKGYLYTHKKMQDMQPRFDVIEVYLHKDSKEILKINHIENAFGV